MKIVFLEAQSIGDDIDLSGFDALGEVVKYPIATAEQTPELIADADVAVLSKIPVNEATIGAAKNLKLVCLTATGTNNLDKDYLDSHDIAWRNVADYSTESVAQHTFAMLFYLLEKLRYYDDYVKDGAYTQDTVFTHFDERNHRSWQHRTPCSCDCIRIWCQCHLRLCIRKNGSGRLSSGRSGHLIC